MPAGLDLIQHEPRPAAQRVREDVLGQQHAGARPRGVLHPRGHRRRLADQPPAADPACGCTPAGTAGGRRSAPRRSAARPAARRPGPGPARGSPGRTPPLPRPRPETTGPASSAGRTAPAAPSSVSSPPCSAWSSRAAISLAVGKTTEAARPRRLAPRTVHGMRERMRRQGRSESAARPARTPSAPRPAQGQHGRNSGHYGYDKHDPPVQEPLGSSVASQPACSGPAAARP